MGLLQKIDNAITKASSCPGCSHSAPGGVAGCSCSRSDCTC